MYVSCLDEDTLLSRSGRGSLVLRPQVEAHLQPAVRAPERRHWGRHVDLDPVLVPTLDVLKERPKHAGPLAAWVILLLASRADPVPGRVQPLLPARLLLPRAHHRVGRRLVFVEPAGQREDHPRCPAQPGPNLIGYNSREFTIH